MPINKQTQVIWGQNEGYFYLQLRDFKRGTRKNPLMEPIAAQFEKKDMYALAAYFTKKKWPDLGQPSAPGPSLPRPTLRRGQLAAAAVASIIFRATPVCYYCPDFCCCLLLECCWPGLRDSF